LDSRKAIVVGVLLFIVLWWLMPPRQLGNAPAAKEGVVEIAFMGPGGPLAGAMADVIRAFETQSERDHAADPSKPIYRVVSGQDASRDQTSDPTRFLVSVAGNSSPDVIKFDRYAVAEWAARGGFEPLDDYLARDKAAGIDTPERSKFFTAPWDEGMYGGKQYGIPISVDDRILMFNRDAFKRAGLVDAKGEPVPPRTWEQTREYLRKLTLIEDRKTGQQLTLAQYFDSLPPDAPRKLNNDTHKLVTVGFIPMYGNSWLYIYGWMNGGEFMSKDGKTVTLNDPKIVGALTWIKSIYDELGGYQQVKSFEAGFQDNALDPFVTGKVAMKIDGFWTINNLGQYARNLDFGTAPPPLPQATIDAGTDKLSWIGGWVYAIPATARHKEAAWELIRFLNSPKAIAMRIEAERQFARAEGRFYFPEQNPQIAINDWQYEKYVFEDPSIDEKYKAAIRTYNDLLPFSRYRPITPVGQQLWNYHVTATEETLGGTKTAQAAVDQANAILQTQLDRFFKPTQGKTITSWTWFFVLYGAILLLLGTLAVLWDTRLGFRRPVARMLGLSRATGDSVIEGANGGFTRSQWFGGFVCVSPWLIGFIIFGGGPMLFSLVISFCRWDILNQPVVTGLDNYKIMWSDDLVWKSLGNTLYMMLGVPIGLALSLAIALLLNQGVKALAGWRTIFYLPSIVPIVATSLLFVWIFNPQAGLLTKVFETLTFHMIRAPQWLQDPTWAKSSLILMGLWGAGGGMILWLAGLKSIPQSLYEAASVDGASTIQQFFKITIPQLTPYIFFNLVIGVIGTLQVFGQAFIMTQGGPQNSTLFYVYYLFNNAFRYGQMGYASAMAWLLFAVALIFTLVQMRLSRRWVSYDTA
jgi:ABC-type sugar transport system permease subunit/ABC-type glycerol-3-phosphate transport system substrate-binding protein